MNRSLFPMWRLLAAVIVVLSFVSHVFSGDEPEVHFVDVGQGTVNEPSSCPPWRSEAPTVASHNLTRRGRPVLRQRLDKYGKEE